MNSQELNQLIINCQKGQESSQKQLYFLFLNHIKSIVRRYLYNSSNSADVIQEIYIKIFAKLNHSYEPEKGELKHWITRIAINTIYDTNRKNKQHMTYEIDEKVKQIKVTHNVFFKLDKENIFAFVNQMPESMKIVFNLYIIDQLTHPEIAELLDCSIDASKKRLSRARTWLKNRFIQEQNHLEGYINSTSLKS